MTRKVPTVKVVSCIPAKLTSDFISTAKMVKAIPRKSKLKIDITHGLHTVHSSPSIPSKSKWDIFCALYGSRDGLCECYGTDADGLLYEVVVGSNPLWKDIIINRMSHAHRSRDIRLWYALIKTGFSKTSAATLAQIDKEYAYLVGAPQSQRGKQLRNQMRDGEIVQSFACELLNVVGLEIGGMLEVGIAASVIYLVADVLNSGLLMPSYIAKIALTELFCCMGTVPTSASDPVSPVIFINTLFRIVEPWTQTALFSEWREMLSLIIRNVACTLTDGVRAVAQELQFPSPALSRWEWRLPRVSTHDIWIAYPAPFSAAIDTGLAGENSRSGNVSVQSSGWTEEISFVKGLAVRGGTWLEVRHREPEAISAPPLRVLAVLGKTPIAGPLPTRTNIEIIEQLNLMSLAQAAVSPAAAAAPLRVPSAVATFSRPDSGQFTGNEDVDWASPTKKISKKKRKELKHWSEAVHAQLLVSNVVHSTMSVEPHLVRLKHQHAFEQYYVEEDPTLDPGETGVKGGPDHVCSGFCSNAPSSVKTDAAKPLPSAIAHMLERRSIDTQEVSLWMHDENSVQMVFLMPLGAVLRVLHDTSNLKCDAKLLFARLKKRSDQVERVDVSYYANELKPRDPYGLLALEAETAAASTPTPPATPCTELVAQPTLHTFTFDAFLKCTDGEVDQLVRSALVCHGGGVGLIRFLLEAAKNDQASRLQAAQENETQEEEEDDGEEKFTFFSPEHFANISHLSLVVEVSPVDKIATIAKGDSIEERSRGLHDHSKKGSRCLSLCAAVACEIRRYSGLHVPLPLGGEQLRAVIPQRRNVNDFLPFAEIPSTSFKSRMPINRQYLFNFVKSDAEKISLRGAEALANKSASSNSSYTLASRCASVPLRTMDGSALDKFETTLPPPMPAGRQPQPSRDIMVLPPSSFVDTIGTPGPFTPEIFSPSPMGTSTIDLATMRGMLFRSRSLAPGSVDEVKATKILETLRAKSRGDPTDSKKFGEGAKSLRRVYPQPKDHIR